MAPDSRRPQWAAVARAAAVWARLAVAERHIFPARMAPVAVAEESWAPEPAQSVPVGAMEASAVVVVVARRLAYPATAAPAMPAIVRGRLEILAQMPVQAALEEEEEEEGMPPSAPPAASAVAVDRLEAIAWARAMGAPAVGARAAPAEILAPVEPLAAA